MEERVSNVVVLLLPPSHGHGPKEPVRKSKWQAMGGVGKHGVVAEFRIHYATHLSAAVFTHVTLVLGSR